MDVFSDREPLVAVFGKSQPLHNEHLLYILGAFRVGEHVTIGITDPDPVITRHRDADPGSALEESNPSTYHERCQMIKNSLADVGVEPDRYDIVPFPVNLPWLWQYYIPGGGGVPDHATGGRRVAGIAP
jgi:nicotinamide mononucleotide adenylyltransferase